MITQTPGPASMPPPPDRPALSVLMSVHNGGAHLAPAIRSVIGQSFADFEFLILDDGSADASPRIIGDAAMRDSRIRPILRENRGLVASLNELLALARAPLCARMDADDLCHPDRFARQVAFLAGHRDHGVVGTLSDEIDDAGQPWPYPGPAYPITNEAFQRNVRTQGPLLIHPAVMFRTGLVRSAGGYHRAFRHCEDYDLWLRLASITKVANLPERLLVYRHYAGQVSRRHVVEQQTGAAIAWEAWRARDAGRADPTAHLARLPPINALDGLFGEAGVSRRVRARVVREILYSREGLRGEGFGLLLDHLRDGGEHAGLWRTAARLVRFGAPWRAGRLAAALALAPAAPARPPGAAPRA